MHQLNGMTPANPLFNIYCGNLRQDAVDEIRENFVFYEEHLSRYAAELVSGDAPAAEKVETYLTNLETPGYWGGAECLSAISNRYKVKIQVYQGTGRVTFSPLGSPTEPPVLRVFYRGGNGTPNHYDSIICVRPRNLVKPIQAIPICGPAGPSLLQSIIIQLTGAIPTETELNVFRWLVAEDADTRGPPFLAECGVGTTERKNFTFRIRLGSIEGDAVTFVSLAALLRLRIYVRYPNGDSLRYDPAEEGHLAAISVTGNTAASTTVLPKTDPTHTCPPPDPYDLARAVVRGGFSATQSTIAEEIQIDRSRGLRFATLNLNGCRLSAKRDSLDSYLSSRRIHIAAVQEVNLECERTATKNYDWHLGKTATNRRRGLAVLVRKGTSITLSAISTRSPYVQMHKVGFTVRTESKKERKLDFDD